MRLQNIPNEQVAVRVLNERRTQSGTATLGKLPGGRIGAVTANHVTGGDSRARLQFIGQNSGKKYLETEVSTIAADKQADVAGLVLPKKVRGLIDPSSLDSFSPGKSSINDEQALQQMREHGQLGLAEINYHLIRQKMANQNKVAKLGPSFPRGQISNGAELALSSLQPANRYQTAYKVNSGIVAPGVSGGPIVQNGEIKAIVTAGTPNGDKVIATNRRSNALGIAFRLSAQAA